MSKKQFIRDAVNRERPNSAKEVMRVVEQAIKRWDVLTVMGFGDPKPSTPRDTRNYYDELSQHQKVWFDKFWTAFDYKQGLQRAALAWSKLGELSEQAYQKIVDAAAIEKAKPRNDTEVRKMAEGWLSERRFDDQTTVKKPAVSNTRVEMSNLQNELRTLEGFNKATPTEAYQQRIEEIKIILDEMRSQ